MDKLRRNLLSIHENAIDSATTTVLDDTSAAQQAIDLMLSVLSDGLDHPELWTLMPSIVAENPLIPDTLLQRAAIEPSVPVRIQMRLLLGLAHRIGASSVYFGRITNWGTFSAADYAQTAIVMPRLPDHEEFFAACRDPRLRDPIACTSDLDEFIHGIA
jgi:hypothetical protein